jgi:four helix bundle protein
MAGHVCGGDAAVREVRSQESGVRSLTSLDSMGRLRAPLSFLGSQPVMAEESTTDVTDACDTSTRTPYPRACRLAQGSRIRTSGLSLHEWLSTLRNLCLASQMRRAAVSIPANIAEGFRRHGRADKARFLNVAEGSVEECRYFLVLASDLGYGDTSTLSDMLEEISKMLHAYRSAILASDF